MSITIRTVHEGPRGCGYRKPGGLYLIAGAPTEPCPKLPIALTACPTCGGGIKPARSWTWVDADRLTDPGPHGDSRHSAACPLTPGTGPAGLIWVGQGFYPTPSAFLTEAGTMGICRLITTVPRDLVVGETWVLLAHRSALPPIEAGGEKQPGIFSLFRPTRIEYVVRGTERDEELERLAARGIEPVRVERADSGHG